MRIVRILFSVLIIMLAVPSFTQVASAEYGDKILNNYASQLGMRPVIFPHWTHRVRVKCKVCHQDLGFKIMAGSNDIKMVDIMQGKYCGACHNGQVAWPAMHCDRCHSGEKPAGALIPTANIKQTTPQETKGYTVQDISGGGN